MLHDIDLRKIFKCTHLKFMVSGQFIHHKQIDTCVQCSHTSVGLTQARPNNWWQKRAGNETTNNHVCRLQISYSKTNDQNKWSYRYRAPSSIKPLYQVGNDDQGGHDLQSGGRKFYL